jgi:hypothetical protein
MDEELLLDLEEEEEEEEVDESRSWRRWMCTLQYIDVYITVH